MTAKLPPQLAYTPINAVEYSQQAAIVTALTQGVQEILEEMQLKAQLFGLWMDDPDLCDPEWLDFLAYLNGWGGDYWDGSWEPTIKRALIKNSDWVWRNQTTPAILPYLFGVFGLQATLKRSRGWILGPTPTGTKFPQTLSGDWKNVKIQVPANYKPSTREYQLVKQITETWKPAWVEFLIEILP